MYFSIFPGDQSEFGETCGFAWGNYMVPVPTQIQHVIRVWFFFGDPFLVGFEGKPEENHHLSGDRPGKRNPSEQILEALFQVIGTAQVVMASARDSLFSGSCVAVSQLLSRWLQSESGSAWFALFPWQSLHSPTPLHMDPKQGVFAAGDSFNNGWVGFCVNLRKNRISLSPGTKLSCLVQLSLLGEFPVSLPLVVYMGHKDVFFNRTLLQTQTYGCAVLVDLHATHANS